MTWQDQLGYLVSCAFFVIVGVGLVIDWARGVFE